MACNELRGPDQLFLEIVEVGRQPDAAGPDGHHGVRTAEPRHDGIRSLTGTEMMVERCGTGKDRKADAFRFSAACRWRVSRAFRSEDRADPIPPENAERCLVGQRREPRQRSVQLGRRRRQVHGRPEKALGRHSGRPSSRARRVEGRQAARGGHRGIPCPGTRAGICGWRRPGNQRRRAPRPWDIAPAAWQASTKNQAPERAAMRLIAGRSARYPVAEMHGADGDEPGAAVGRLAERLGLHAVAVGSHGTDLVAAFPEQEPGVVVRGEFVLGDHDVLPGSWRRQVGGHDSRQRCSLPGRWQSPPLRLDDPREHGAGVLPARSASSQSNRPSDQRSDASSYASLAGAQPAFMVAVLR